MYTTFVCESCEGRNFEIGNCCCGVMGGLFTTVTWCSLRTRVKSYAFHQRNNRTLDTRNKKNYPLIDLEQRQTRNLRFGDWKPFFINTIVTHSKRKIVWSQFANLWPTLLKAAWLVVQSVMHSIFHSWLALFWHARVPSTAVPIDDESEEVRLADF